jgi:hypothetical protein
MHLSMSYRMGWAQAQRQADVWRLVCLLRHGHISLSQAHTCAFTNTFTVVMITSLQVQVQVLVLYKYNCTMNY